MEKKGKEHHPSPTVINDHDREILDNIGGRLHGPMKGFFQKYFSKSLAVHRDGNEAPPAETSELLAWLTRQLQGAVEGARGSWLAEAEEEGTRFLLDLSAPDTSPPSKLWSRVEVVGRFSPLSPDSARSSHEDYRRGLLRLCRSADAVFSAQPTRLFLHGFYMRGLLAEFCVFDRSGLYCSDVIHALRDPGQLTSILGSYRHMTTDDLGSSSILQTGQSSVDLDQLGRLYLDIDHPIAARQGIVGSGVTCYRARLSGSSGASSSLAWTHVVKFKWRWARQRPEDELLRKTGKIWGGVTLDHYQERESTANLRRSLRWGTHRRLSSQTADLPDHPDMSDADGLEQHTVETNDYFQNRILTCVVTSPLGRPLHSFQSTRELLCALRDALRCHQSLLRAGILHQDVSHGNIVILDEEAGRPRGLLIDLDVSVEVTANEDDNDNDDSNNENSISGTLPFMAIGVLRRQKHTFRHDLESFLYVLLWTILANHAENPPAGPLRQWSGDGNDDDDNDDNNSGTKDRDWDALARQKTLSMEEAGFRRILDAFAPEFARLRPLARRLHAILFVSPLAGSGPGLWTGTDTAPGAKEGLYGSMLAAFEEAIEDGD